MYLENSKPLGEMMENEFTRLSESKGFDYATKTSSANGNASPFIQDHGGCANPNSDDQ